MKKRWISMALALLMAVSLAPSGAAGHPTTGSGTCGEDLTWTLGADHVLTISGTGPMWGDDEYSDHDKNPIFSDYVVSDVVIEPGVTTIGACAFSGCMSLQSITIPSSVTRIGPSAFRDCTALKSIVIPDGVKSIERNAFADCTHLTSVSLPDSLESIGSSAFVDCLELTDIAIPGSVAAIGASTFYDCRSMTGITIPEGVTSIGGGAFYHCESLTYVSIPSSVTAVESYAFQNCSQVRRVLIRNEALCLSSQAFPLKSVEDVLFAGSEEVWTANGNRSSGLPSSARYHFNVKDFDDHFTQGHNDLTCTQDGCDLETCVCGYEIKTNVVKAPGHKWDDGTETKQPTEAEEGEKTFTCTVCGETKTEPIPKLAPPPTPTPTPAPVKPTPTPTPAPVKPTPTPTPAPVKPTPTTSPKPTPTPTPAPSAKPEIKNPFTDVEQKQYYYDSVLWAVNHTPQITAGTSATTFSPAATCTRGQVVTFLWRAAGCPEPKLSVNPFRDVKDTDYFYQAVLWAAENGVTAGTSATTFSPGAPCTRGHVVTFLWRTAGRPGPKLSVNPFRDVKSADYFYQAVLWAAENGVTAGTSAAAFSPANPCTRGQIVTFLYRDMK